MGYRRSIKTLHPRGYRCDLSLHYCPSVWTRLMDGITLPIDFQIYYKCIFCFIVLCAYLLLGGVILWAIERDYHTDGTIYKTSYWNKDKQIFKSVRPEKEYSASWSIFDAVFMCFSVASGSGIYSEMEIDTKLGKIFVVVFSLIGCPLVSIVTSGIGLIVKSWIYAILIFLSNSLDIFWDFVFNNSLPENPLKSQRSLDEIFKRKSLGWPQAIFYFLIYTYVGSWALLFTKDVELFDMFWKSFEAFTTVQISKVFNVPARGVIYLLYLLCGIAVFQICVESVRVLIEDYWLDYDNDDEDSLVSDVSRNTMTKRMMNTKDKTK